MAELDMKAAPFHLDAAALRWVDDSFGRLGDDDKVRQLFNLRCAGNDATEIARMQAFRPGSVTRITGPDWAAEQRILAAFNAAAPVPLLVSADLEGSRMSLAGGTEVPNPLALAALDDVEATREISRIMAAEARAIGINWSFTPVLDINAAFRSAIVATRGFGSDVASIERHAVAQIEAFRAAGVGTAVKHWPGEGFDDRDQHLVTTVNPLEMAEWERHFGRLYRAAIAAGTLSVMSAHIALPAYVRQADADAGVEAFRPASISSLLNDGLLRGELGFNGLVVSDASGMGGLDAWSARADYLPQLIANGCDVILFTRNAERDRQWIVDALEDGRLSQARVDDAVRRQLAMKAALGLHRGEAPAPRPDPAASQRIAEAATQRVPTLVKDTQGLLPLEVTRHRRVLVYSTGVVLPLAPGPLPFELPQMLEQRGFEVTLHEPGTPDDPEAYDLVLYLMGEESLLTRSHIFVDWMRLNGDLEGAMRRTWNDVPTLMVSFGHPYYLYDAPRMPTYVNAYSTARSMQAAVVRALLGEAAWNTHSPVDPFVDPQARY